MANRLFFLGAALLGATFQSPLLAACGPNGCSPGGYSCYDDSCYDCGGGFYSGTGIYYGVGDPEPLTEAPSNRALIIIGLPDEKAEVYFEGQLTGSVGTKRQFLTPPLEDKKLYEYEVKVIHMLAEEGPDKVLFADELRVEEKVKVTVAAGLIFKIRASVDDAGKLALRIAPTKEEVDKKLNPPAPTPATGPGPAAAPSPEPPKAPGVDDSKKDAEVAIR